MTDAASRPLVLTTRADLRAALAGIAPGFVPTMGSLHDGHLSLIRWSARENDRTVVSIFVNPTQFADPDDLARYPRSLERDIALAIAAGADDVFAPTTGEIYPAGFATGVDVGGLSDRWEGEARPGHFRGVATVVALLLNLVHPARSYFGEKDYQQLQVVRRLHADLALPGEIVGCPTVRAEDGLALSSRNVRLSPAGRVAAASLPRALMRMAELAAKGITNVAELKEAAAAILGQAPILTVDYLEVVDAATLDPVRSVRSPARALAAAVVDGVRLIDNVELPIPTR